MKQISLLILLILGMVFTSVLAQDSVQQNRLSIEAIYSPVGLVTKLKGGFASSSRIAILSLQVHSTTITFRYCKSKELQIGRLDMPLESSEEIAFLY
ncbi:MAG: hypothetical protein V1799_21520 [bacterium]